jgi:hypothetical protein
MVILAHGWGMIFAAYRIAAIRVQTAAKEP